MSSHRAFENISAIFLARAEILLQAISEAAFPFVLIKVGACVFVFSLLSSIGRTISSPLNCVLLSHEVFSVLKIASVNVYARAEFLRGAALAVV